MAKVKFSIKKFLISNWFITMFSTMFGVLAGLYLANHFEAKKFKLAQQDAIEMIKEELNTNHELLMGYDSISRLKIDKVAYFFSKVKGDLKSSQILIHKDSLESFNDNTKGLLSNIKVERMSSRNDSLQIAGDVNMDIDSQLILGELSNIAWSSYKQTNYVDVTNFQCITKIELLYQLQKDFNALNEIFRGQYLNGYWLEGEEQREEVIQQWVKVIQRGGLLNQAYETRDDVFSDYCN